MRSKPAAQNSRKMVRVGFCAEGRKRKSFRCKRAAAEALDFTWAGILAPGMTVETNGFFRHHARAHWDMGTSAGTSVWRKLSTSARSRCRFSSFHVARTSSAGKVAPGRYLPVRSEERRV